MGKIKNKIDLRDLLSTGLFCKNSKQEIRIKVSSMLVDTFREGPTINSIQFDNYDKLLLCTDPTTRTEENINKISTTYDFNKYIDIEKIREEVIPQVKELANLYASLYDEDVELNMEYGGIYSEDACISFVFKEIQVVFGVKYLCEDMNNHIMYFVTYYGEDEDGNEIEEDDEFSYEDIIQHIKETAPTKSKNSVYDLEIGDIVHKVNDTYISIGDIPNITHLKYIKSLPNTYFATKEQAQKRLEWLSAENQLLKVAYDTAKEMGIDNPFANAEERLNAEEKKYYLIFDSDSNSVTFDYYYFNIKTTIFTSTNSYFIGTLIGRINTNCLETFKTYAVGWL